MAEQSILPPGKISAAIATAVALGFDVVKLLEKKMESLEFLRMVEIDLKKINGAATSVARETIKWFPEAVYGAHVSPETLSAMIALGVLFALPSLFLDKHKTAGMDTIQKAYHNIQELIRIPCLVAAPYLLARAIDIMSFSMGTLHKVPTDANSLAVFGLTTVFAFIGIKEIQSNIKVLERMREEEALVGAYSTTTKLQPEHETQVGEKQSKPASVQGTVVSEPIDLRRGRHAANEGPIIDGVYHMFKPEPGTAGD